MWDTKGDEQLTFLQLVTRCAQQLEGAYAICVKVKLANKVLRYQLKSQSHLFPGEVIATRRGSPLLIGISSSSKLNCDHIPIMYSAGTFQKIKKRYLDRAFRLTNANHYLRVDSKYQLDAQDPKKRKLVTRNSSDNIFQCKFNFGSFYNARV